MMRIKTDHAFHIGSQHLRGGLPCQDYALSGGDSASSYAIVSDGCSTGGRTDVGARVVALNTARALRLNAVFERFDVAQSCSNADTVVRANLGLSTADMLATCLYIQASASRQGIYAHLFGDGVVACRYRDGSVWMTRLDWRNNMPIYRAYEADHFESFKAAHGESEEATWIRSHFRRNDGAPAPASDWQDNCGLQKSLHGKEYYFNSEDFAEISEVAVFSDGVTQVDRMDWRDVVAELMAFKSTEGDFVKRRMNRFLKDSMQHGKGPIDDISMAAIHIDREAA